MVLIGAILSIIELSSLFSNKKSPHTPTLLYSSTPISPNRPKQHLANDFSCSSAAAAAAAAGD